MQPVRPVDPKRIAWDARGLAPAIVQDADSGVVRMLGWMNAEALERTQSSGEVWFYSRSREALWHKGETSGNTLAVREVRFDCDADAILVRAIPAGPTCHTGAASCFFEPTGDSPAGARPHVLTALAATLRARVGGDPTVSYTAQLLADGPDRIAGKIREEGGELADAVTDETDERVVSEAADVIYHLLVALTVRDIDPSAVWAELERRTGLSGLEEKASRT